jgi:hypothetical protein
MEELKKSKYIESTWVKLLPNGVYQLCFNTTERWLNYHNYNDHEFSFGQNEDEDNHDVTYHQITEFLPRDNNDIIWLTSSNQNKDQITFYYIPFDKNWIKNGDCKMIDIL